jgi:hypothetical protein
MKRFACLFFIAVFMLTFTACGVSREEHERLVSEVEILRQEIKKINESNPVVEQQIQPEIIPPTEVDCISHDFEFMYISALTVTMNGIPHEVEGVDYHNHKCVNCGLEEPHSSLERCICGINHPCAIRHDYSIYFFTGALIDSHEYGHQCRRLCGFMPGREDWEHWWQLHDGDGKCSKCNFN